jgi:hypothetical protein
MSDEREYVICTSKDESVCVACELEGKLNCRFDEDLVKCFRNRHLPYRVLAFLVVGVASFLTGFWWAFFLFVAVTFLNFAVIETWYLCRHCPFYEKEGRTLKCITLKGIPRIWKFDLSPIKRSSRIGMMIVGGFIDLFPVLIGIYATWIQFSAGDNLLLTILMANLTIISLAVAGYLKRFIGENYCKKCVNLSCIMNKVPDELKEGYLRKNPEMLKAWEACGHVLR